MRHNHRRNTSAAKSPRVKPQPPYHEDISVEYLDAMQRAVDETKPKGFILTPISAPGW